MSVEWKLSNNACRMSMQNSKTENDVVRSGEGAPLESEPHRSDTVQLWLTDMSNSFQHLKNKNDDEKDD